MQNSAEKKKDVHAEKDHLCFYKNSTNQTLSLSAAK